VLPVPYRGSKRRRKKKKKDVILFVYLFSMVHAVVQSVEALRYKPAGRAFNSR
jgi:hypothetical protein